MAYIPYYIDYADGDKHCAYLGTCSGAIEWIIKWSLREKWVREFTKKDIETLYDISQDKIHDIIFYGFRIWKGKELVSGFKNNAVSKFTCVKHLLAAPTEAEGEFSEEFKKIVNDYYDFEVGMIDGQIQRATKSIEVLKVQKEDFINRKFK